MLKLVLPKGSLEQATLQLFEDANLRVSRSSDVAYKATIADERVADVRILRPQEIPRYVADGLFDIGITGRDWIEETSSDVVTLGELEYSKATDLPVKVVLAVDGASNITEASQLAGGVRVSTEYPELTRRYFEKLGIEAEIILSYGATEAKVPDIVDVAVDITETGRALRAAGLRIIDTLLISRTELIANPTSAADADKRRAMEQLQRLLVGVLTARGKVLLKMNVDAQALNLIMEMLPAEKVPTVNELYQGAGYAIESVVPRNELNVIIPKLRDLGATDIVEIPISKIIP